jgi:hypothetical protein
LGGDNALISDHFYYFGDQPISLPESLWPIVHQTQGHKSRANEQYVTAFEDWIQGLQRERNKVYGEPALRQEIMLHDSESKCSARDCAADEEDEIC